MSFPWRFSGAGYIQFPAPSSNGPSFGAQGKIRVEFKWSGFTPDPLNISVIMTGSLSATSTRFPFLWIEDSKVLKFLVSDGVNQVIVASSNEVRVGNNVATITWDTSTLTLNLNGTETSVSNTLVAQQSDYGLRIGALNPPSYPEYFVGIIRSLKAWSNPNAPLDSVPDVLNLGPQTGSYAINLSQPEGPFGQIYGGAHCLVKPARKGFRSITNDGKAVITHHSDLSFSDNGGVGAVLFAEGYPLKAGEVIRKGTLTTNTNYVLYWGAGSGDKALRFYATTDGGWSGIGLSSASLFLPMHQHVTAYYSAGQVTGYFNGVKAVEASLGNQLYVNDTDPVWIGYKCGYVYGTPACTIPLAYILNKSIIDWEPTDADIATLEMYLAMGDYNRAIRFLKDKTVGLWLLTEDNLYQDSSGNWYFEDLSEGHTEPHPAYVQGVRGVDYTIE